MEIFKTINDYEQLLFFNKKELGLKGIICIHSTKLGPSLGGCRLFNYTSEEDAILDVTKLAKGMTYKSAISGLNWGGGKAVIIADTKKIKREYIFRAFGKYVESLNGRYITAEDVNTSPSDMFYVSQSTRYVAGLSNKSGNPSLYTAKSTYLGMKAAAKYKFNVDTLKDLRVAVQGVGSVAQNLIKLLKQEGAIVTIADINSERCKFVQDKFGVKVVSPEEILSIDCDILSPCAMGGIINDKTIGNIKAKVIAGCANNQLFNKEITKQLDQLGIVYAPDYVVNAGGLISVTREFGLSEQDALHKLDNIYHTVMDVLNTSKEKNISTLDAADIVAEDRLANIDIINTVYTQRNRFTYSKD